MTGALVDISEGGLHCRTEHGGIRVGQSGSVTFALDGRELTIHDRVVTSDSASGVEEIGMSFDGAPAEVMSVLRAFLARQQ